MDNALRNDRAAFFASFFKDFFGVGIVSKPVSSELLEWTCSIGMQASFKAIVDCANAFATTEFRPDLKSIEVPALIFHGTEDKTVPIDDSALATMKRGVVAQKRGQEQIEAEYRARHSLQYHESPDAEQNHFHLRTDR